MTAILSTTVTYSSFKLRHLSDMLTENVLNTGKPLALGMQT